MFLVQFLFYFLTPIVNADPVIKLPAVIKEATPIDALTEDLIIPSQTTRLSDRDESGFLAESLKTNSALPLGTSLSPGSLAQFRGLGRSASDIQIQALGISLNPIQGGGFDLSTFPSFIWSEYSLRLGPSLTGVDPHSSSGTLILMPWTAQSLSESKPQTKFSGLYSDAGLSQVAVAVRDRGNVAAVVGYNEGDSKGPAGAISSQWKSGGFTGRMHFLGTRLDSSVKGARSFPTPLARQLTARVVPVLEATHENADGHVMKASLYFDGSYIRYSDPMMPSSFTQDHIWQAGFETGWFYEKWRMGFSGKKAMYEGIGFSPPPEYSGSVLLGRSFEEGSWLFEPTAQLAGVSGFGLVPSASFGVKKKLSPESLAVFTRFNYTRKFPSLLDRYYSFSIFRNNPELKPERDWSWVLGTQWTAKGWENVNQVFFQFRQDAQVPTITGAVPNQIYSTANFSHASVAALNSTLSVQATGWMNVTSSVTVSRSWVSGTGLSFPYLPTVIEVFSVSVSPLSSWMFRGAARLSSSAVSNAFSGEQVAGYGAFDVEAAYLIKEGVRLTARVENLFDRGYELIQDYPFARVISLGVSGVL